MLNSSQTETRKRTQSEKLPTTIGELKKTVSLRPLKFINSFLFDFLFQSYAPEVKYFFLFAFFVETKMFFVFDQIYLLEGRHDDYAHLPTSSPALSSSSRLFPNRQPARQDFENQLLPTFNGKPLRTGRNNYQSILPNGPVSQVPSSSGRQSWTKLTNISSGKTYIDRSINH